MALEMLGAENQRQETSRDVSDRQRPWRSQPIGTGRFAAMPPNHPKPIFIFTLYSHGFIHHHFERDADHFGYPSSGKKRHLNFWTNDTMTWRSQCPQSCGKTDRSSFHEAKLLQSLQAFAVSP